MTSAISNSIFPLDALGFHPADNPLQISPTYGCIFRTTGRSPVVLLKQPYETIFAT